MVYLGRILKKTGITAKIQYPNTECIVYLPTFTIKIDQYVGKHVPVP